MFSLKDQVAIVTGGASGIGRSTAQLLALQGAKVVVSDRDFQAATCVVDALRSNGHEALSVPLEVTDPSQSIDMVEKTLKTYGRLDILVHSAGVGVERRFLEMAPEEWRRILDIDLSGTFYCCQAAARAMASSGYGRIIVLSSTAGIRGGTGRAAYGSAKGGVIAMTKVMAVELAEFGITVNALAPGAIETELVKRMHDAETRRAYLSSIPMDRYGTPEEVASAAVFLASTESGYITGHTLTIDGGFVAAGVMKRSTPQ